MWSWPAASALFGGGVDHHTVVFCVLDALPVGREAHVLDLHSGYLFLYRPVHGIDPESGADRFLGGISFLRGAAGGNLGALSLNRGLLCLLLAMSAGAHARGDIQVLNSDAHYPEGPIWYHGKLYYVEYDRNTVTTWDGVAGVIFVVDARGRLMKKRCM